VARGACRHRAPDNRNNQSGALRAVLKRPAGAPAAGRRWGLRPRSPYLPEARGADRGAPVPFVPVGALPPRTPPPGGRWRPRTPLSDRGERPPDPPVGPPRPPSPAGRRMGLRAPSFRVRRLARPRVGRPAVGRGPLGGHSSGRGLRPPPLRRAPPAYRGVRIGGGLAGRGAGAGHAFSRRDRRPPPPAGSRAPASLRPRARDRLTPPLRGPCARPSSAVLGGPRLRSGGLRPRGSPPPHPLPFPCPPRRSPAAPAPRRAPVGGARRPPAGRALVPVLPPPPCFLLLFVLFCVCRAAVARRLVLVVGGAVVAASGGLVVGPGRVVRAGSRSLALGSRFVRFPWSWVWSAPRRAGGSLVPSAAPSVVVRRAGGPAFLWRRSVPRSARRRGPVRRPLGGAR